MITSESDEGPTSTYFDTCIVAVGFEQRCRWVVSKHKIRTAKGVGLQFGFLAEGSYDDNQAFFLKKGFELAAGLSSDTPSVISEAIQNSTPSGEIRTIFVDISSMSRQMIANVVLGINLAAAAFPLRVTVAYAPSKFVGPVAQAPIRFASPILPDLAGWSSTPEKPLAAIFGLGAEEGLALGALQTLEPDKAWLFTPKGIDTRYDKAMLKANEHIADIFEVNRFDYDIVRPTATRARIEYLLNSIDGYFRVVSVPFGPKIFSWLSLSTVVFEQRNEVGVWAFSSKEHGKVVDRRAQGQIIWHTMTVIRPT
ncbi:hypothetical protein NP945_15245 [Mesorhizobium sp. LMG17149]|uniref:hypothetical protein n=1 Tax=Mesorhizobium sp. LMG17149 TaxID=2968497 RepID=UPI002119083B|nr:hypothetical protein [Mesorhizobium sp. LMG17149]MCQ8873187.1 hypothetical protein [Mesorhizobium sp. LMG17149]